MQTKQTDLARLLMGTKVFVVPQFQRHYKWKAAQWQELWDDIVEQYLSEDVQSGKLSKDEGHFLGSIVLHPAPGPASTVSRYWVIDGQQRLTSLLVLIAALRDLRAREEPMWDPKAYTNLYLANPYNLDDPHRLVLGANDRSDFISAVYAGRQFGQVGRAYSWFLSALEKLLKSEDGLDFEQFQNALFLRLILVEINTSDEDNINQIFNTINHSGMRLSAIDLIRNHSFMQFDSESATEVYESTWKPMEDALGETDLAPYLWAQLVRGNAKATQRDLYGPFQAHLSQAAGTSRSMADVTRAELTRLRDEVDLFRIATSKSRTLEAGLDPLLAKALIGLQEWGSQTYIPLALELLSRSRNGLTSAHSAASALQLVLSYMVRRGLAGIPTNNLNRILSAIPHAIRDESDPVAGVGRELLSGGKYWPRDREVVERAASTPIYLTLQARQVKFVLGEINDWIQPKEAVSRDGLTVEHFMPRELNHSWRRMLEEAGVSEDVADSRLHVLGNLTLTGYNSELGRKDPEEKARILGASNLPLNRKFPVDSVWTPTEIDARSNSLATLAVAIWRRPFDSDSGREKLAEVTAAGPQDFNLALLLDSLPADKYIPLSELAELIAQTDKATRASVSALNPSLIRVIKAVEVVVGLADLSDQELEEIERMSISDLIVEAQSLGSKDVDPSP